MSEPHPPAHVYQKDGFNLVAHSYDLVARLSFGGAIQEAQRRLVPSVLGARHALMIGGGAGEALRETLITHPTLKVTYLEASSKMISLAQARLTPAQRAQVTWLHDTHERLFTQPELLRDVDVMITYFFLDVLSPSEARRLIHWVTDQLTAQSSEEEAMEWRWLMADFYPHVGWRGALIQLMYWGFKLLARLHNRSLCDYRALAQACGWVTQGESWHARDMIYSTQLSIYRAPR